MNHQQRLSTLFARGWICKHPESIHPIQWRETVHIEGQIASQERDAWLCITTGLVMLWRGEDFEFDKFIYLLDGKVEAVKAATGQRGLFEDDE